MHRKFQATLAVFGLVALIFAGSGAAAQTPRPPSASQAETQASTGYVLFLPMPRPEGISLPERLTPPQAAHLAQELIEREARSLQNELRHLEQAGKIASFELLPELNAIAVHSTDEQAVQDFAGDALVMPAKEAASCTANASQALQQQLIAMSHAAGLPEETDTDPNITVYIQPGYTYGSVYGYTSASTSVTLRVLRGGAVIANQSTNSSSSSGRYNFYPEYRNCLGYVWLPQAGDVVEVTAHGSKVSTTVANLSAWADPLSNIVAGSTDPGRQVGIEAYSYNPAGLCSTQNCNRYISPDGAGNFSVDLSACLDFNRTGIAYIYSRDANLNNTYTFANAYSLWSDFEGEVGGYLQPNSPYTATLSRAASVIETETGRTSASGEFYDYFSSGYQPGDVISAVGGAVSVSYTTTSFQVSLNPAANQASGTTGPGKRVKAWFYKNDWDEVVTTCNYDGACASATADGGGAFTVNSAIDLVRGDLADFYIYDAEGNYQWAERMVPAIVAQPNWYEISGFWRTPGEMVRINHRDAGNNILEYWDDEWTSSYDGEYGVYPWEYLNPGDKIEVGNGVVTDTMTVQNVTGALNHTTEHLSGSAPNGPLVAELYDYMAQYDYYYYYCRQATVAGGAYDFNYSSAGVDASDDSFVYSTGPDGHYTMNYAHAFWVDAELTGELDGYSMTPGATINAALNQGAATIWSDTTTAYEDGWFYFDPVPAMSPALGQSLVVGDGLFTANLALPVLSINLDPAGNRVFGQSPASQPARVSVYHNGQCYKGSSYWCYGVFQVLATADAGGNYSASFNGLIDYDYDDTTCVNAKVGGQCSSYELTTYRSDEHRISLYQPPPPALAPDSYEGDDTYLTAKPYSGPSSHTWHSTGDLDWIALTIGAGDVGKPLYLRTFNLGPFADTVLRIYDTDGTTQLAQNDDSGGKRASLLVWTPPAEGVYYVRIAPYSSYNTGTCGSNYDFVIYSTRLFMPALQR